MATGAADLSQSNHLNNRFEMLEAFDATQSGVKGLIDTGISKIPRIFVRTCNELAQELTRDTAQVKVPLVDLTDIYSDTERRKLIIEEMRIASETWGFFQVMNHGIPQIILDEMIDGVNKFNDAEAEEKRKYYTRDPKRRVKFCTNFDLFTSKTANWRDTLSISFAGEIPKDELPPPCRESTFEYSKHVENLTRILLELLSEALGLEPNHLNNMIKCLNHVSHMSCHYYPACPEPELAIGSSMHCDVGFLTILLQNQINGLQIMYQDQWIDVQPIRGGLVVNIGDLLQLVSNGKFVSSKHRVVANRIGPRISVACFFSGPLNAEVMHYGPIKELISEDNPPKYKEIVFSEYLHKFVNTGLDQYLGLDYYKL